MRDVIIQLAVLFIVWSLTIELTGWALQAWLGENWWRKMLGEPAEPRRQPAKLTQIEQNVDYSRN